MSSTTRWRKRYRCRKATCKYRFSVHVRKAQPDACPVCRGSVRCIEPERANERAAVSRCGCDVYPFPHAVGTLRMCQQQPLRGVEPTDVEIHEYERLMHTPRGG